MSAMTREEIEAAARSRDEWELELFRAESERLTEEFFERLARDERERSAQEMVAI